MKRKISSDGVPSPHKRRKPSKLETGSESSESRCEPPDIISGKLGGISATSGECPAGNPLHPKLDSVVQKLEDTQPRSRKRTHDFSETLTPEADLPVLTNPKASPETGKRRIIAATGRSQIGQPALDRPPTPVPTNPKSSLEGGNENKKLARRQSLVDDSILIPTPTSASASKEKGHSPFVDGDTSEPVAKKTKHCHWSVTQCDFGPSHSIVERRGSEAGPQSSFEKLPREIRNLIYLEVLGANCRVRRLNKSDAFFQHIFDAERAEYLEAEAQLHLEEQKPPSKLRDLKIRRLKKQMEQESNEGQYYQPIKMLDTTIFCTSKTIYEESRRAFLEGNNIHVLPGLCYHNYYVPEPVAFDRATTCQLLEARRMELICNTAMLPIIAEVLAKRENQPQELHVRLCGVAETTSCIDFISWIRSLVGVRAKVCTLQICKIEAYHESHTASKAVPIDGLCNKFKDHIADIVGIIESRLSIDVEEVRLTTKAI